jgi:UrcA family protein
MTEMTNFTARIAGVATLALAVLPVAALSTAHAATHVPTSVRVADLDLSTASGKAIFAARADHAARIYCSREQALDLKAACEGGVRAELAAKAKGEMRFARN